MKLLKIVLSFIVITFPFHSYAQLSTGVQDKLMKFKNNPKSKSLRLNDEVMFENDLQDLIEALTPNEREHLYSLSLAGVKLKVLPKEIGLLKNLKELNLGDNELTVLPKEIGELTNLIMLNLDGNQITILPPEIKKLKKLDLSELLENQDFSAKAIEEIKAFAKTISNEELRTIVNLDTQKECDLSSSTFTQELVPSRESVFTLLTMSDHFFDAYCPKEKSPLQVTAPLEDPVAVLAELIDHYDTVVVGEMHPDMMSKRVLIELMDKMKASNAILGLEHLYYSSHQKLLDQYLQSKSDEMPAELAKRLDILDQGHGVPNYLGTEAENRGALWKKYNFTELVKEAKRHQVRIVALDTETSYSVGMTAFGSQGIERYKGFNYTSKLILDYEREKKQKVVVLTGSAHNNTRLGVFGVCELNKQAPSIVITDKRKNEGNQVGHRLNVDDGNDGVKADIEFLVPITWKRK
ncbi:MAG: ChaN family lipoprotein [Oligoflexia bacterium]|nr:ChaN family lipoprotein [Oligoflexia bacterium]MBF0364419.1 ChaN family lipoprotein [Oligoflexia bacterium]